MYRGFKLNDDFLTYFEFKDQANVQTYKRVGLEVTRDFKKIIKESLDKYILSDGRINASELQNDWFPQVDAHIFLSHSHKDEEKALILAGFLKEKIGLKVFIDSCIWGYSEDLLKKINDMYNLQENGSYHYSNSNWSAQNVYLMLANALNKMIDNTECIFFLNTPNSIYNSDVKDQEKRTGSPWIYSEINTTQIVRKKIPCRIKDMMEGLEKNNEISNEQIKQEWAYSVDLSHLKEISKKNINEWLASLFSIHDPDKALILLYLKIGNK
jgi:hypothetical protein